MKFGKLGRPLFPPVSSSLSMAWAFLLIGLMTLSAVGRSSAQAVPSTFFAMTTLDPADFPPLTLGAEGHPPQFMWPFIEKKRGSYDFSLIDQYVDDAASKGIPITLAFGKVPGWQQKHEGKCFDFGGGVKSCPGPPNNLDDWKAFLTATAKHYKGRVQYYEIWNEVNLPVTFNGSAEELVDVAKVAYSTIKSIDPAAKVLAPSMGDNPQIETGRWDAWLTHYLQAGGSQYADGGTLHGYTGGKDPEAIVRLTDAARRILDSNGLQGAPLYNTEGGWGVLLPQGEDNQAAFIARWSILQASLFISDNLQSAAWYAWGHPNGNNWGAIEQQDHSPTKAGLAFNEVYKWMVGATIAKPCSFRGQDTKHAIWTCNLTRDGGYQGLAIWNTEGNSNYQAPKQFTHYRDLDGNQNPVPGNHQVPIGAKPILLENN